MNPTDQRYVKFQWQCQLWQFKVFPFGLSSAPYIFYQASSSITEKDGHQTHPVPRRYADNGQVPDPAAEHFQVAAILLKSLRNKSVASPTQQIDFGLQYRFAHYDTILTNPEIVIIDEFLKVHHEQGRGHNKKVVSVTGTDGGCAPSGPPCSLELQANGEVQVIIPETGIFIRPQDVNQPWYMYQRGPIVVGNTGWFI